MMARRVEQIPSMRRIDVEKYSRNHDGPFLQQLLEERLTTISHLSTVRSKKKLRRIFLPSHYSTVAGDWQGPTKCKKWLQGEW
jgi:hypothetical protein